MVGALNVRRWAALLAAATTAVGCSSGERSAPTTPSPQSPTEASCRAAARSVVEPAQAMIDEYRSMTVEEFNALTPPPDLAALQEELRQRAADVVADGCVPAFVEQEVLAAVDDLSGEGEVGAALAAALRGDEDAAARPPRDAEPSQVTVAPGDDVVAVLERVGAGSTVTVAAGSYDIDRTIVIDVGLELIGEGRDETVLASTAEGVALAFIGPGELSVSDVTLRHDGEAPASVVLAIVGGLTLRDVTISGGIAGADGGHGVVFAFEDVDGLPSRTAAQRAGELIVEDSSIVDNEAAGMVLSGNADPVVARSTIAGNGTCGVCYTDQSAGTLSSGIVEDNGEVGIQISGTSGPVIEATTVRRHRVGVLAADEAAATVTASTFEDNELAVQAVGTARTEVVDNVVLAAAGAGISFRESSSGTVRGNQVTDAVNVAIEVADDAAPIVDLNTVQGGAGAGISFTGATASSATGNLIVGRSVGIQVGGSATPTLDANTVRDSGNVGVLLAEQSAATVANNVVTGSVQAAAQVTGTSHPQLSGNELSGGEVGLAYFEGAGGTAAYNRFSGQRIGIQVTGTAAPQLLANALEQSEVTAVAFAETAGGSAEGNRCAPPGGIAIAATATPQIGQNDCPILRQP